MRFKTVKPAFLASLMESGFNLIGELKLEITLRTAFLHNGHFSSGFQFTLRLSVNLPRQVGILHSPSINSYS